MREGKFTLFSTKALFLIVYQFYKLFLVIIFSVLSNPQVTNAQLIFYTSKNRKYPSMLVGTSETVRMFSNCLCSKNEHKKGNDEVNDLKFRQ